MSSILIIHILSKAINKDKKSQIHLEVSLTRDESIIYLESII